MKYPGAKWRISDWIVSHFPTQYQNYIEPFFGSGAILFTKPQSVNEIANDIDGQVINLFKCVRDHGEKLAYLVEMTPYSRQEYYESLNTDASNDLERARKYLVRLWQAYGAKTCHNSGWSHSRYGQVYRTRYWNLLPDRITSIIDRLKTVQFENCCALELIERCNRPDTLLYLDPPYPGNTRDKSYYKNELLQEKDHFDLLQLAKRHKGFVVISTYDNELYSEELAGWVKHNKKTYTHSGASRIETIYLSPNCRTQTTLF